MNLARILHETNESSWLEKWQFQKCEETMTWVGLEPTLILVFNNSQWSNFLHRLSQTSRPPVIFACWVSLYEIGCCLILCVAEFETTTNIFQETKKLINWFKKSSNESSVHVKICFDNPPKNFFANLAKFFSRSARNFKILCFLHIFFLRMFLWIVECSFDIPAAIFVVRLHFVESPKKLQLMFFSNKFFFLRMFPGLLEYPFDNPVCRTADLTIVPKICGAKAE